MDEIIERAHGGVGLRHITKQELERIELLVPPMAVQDDFVAFAQQSDKSKFAALQCCSQSIIPRNDKLYDFCGTYHGSMAIAMYDSLI